MIAPFSNRILIVGGSGFIGSHLVRRCLQMTPHVTILSLHGCREYPLFACDKSRFRSCDIRSPESVRAALSGEPFEYVFNLGGYIDHAPYFEGGRRIIDNHLSGLMNLLDCMDRRLLRRFVQIGSSDEYGNVDSPQREEGQGHPISPYSLAKLAASELIQLLAREEGFPGVVARLFLVYGPGQDKKRFLPQLITACLKDEEVPVTKGEQLRDFCYVDDVIEALIQIALSEEGRGEIVNVASGIPVSVRTMTETVVELIGKGHPCFGARPYRACESMALYADISKANKLLNWRPKIDLRVGLKQTITYYKEFLQL